MKKFIAVLGFIWLAACGPVIDKQYMNRQIAYIDVQAGPKADPAQTALFKNTLQSVLTNRIQGHGIPPALGLTVTIYGFELPRDPYGGLLFSNGQVSGSVFAKGQLWDTASRAVLSEFDLSTRVMFRRQTSLGSVFGNVKGYEPESIDMISVHNKLATVLANNTLSLLYGAQ